MRKKTGLRLNASLTKSRIMTKLVIFDLDSHQISAYHWNNSDTLLENHPACAAFYPAETVRVSMAIQVVGVKDAI